MGYTTEFSGQFDLDKPLADEHAAYLKAFARTRRMQRNASQTAKLPDVIRVAAKLPIGDEGAYYVGVGDQTDFGQTHTADIKDYNSPPMGQPGLWCQWIPTNDGRSIEHDGGEKFYDYVEWIKYLIDHFLAPWGYKVDGLVDWNGEDRGDVGQIEVKRNKVVARKGRIVYSD